MDVGCVFERGSEDRKRHLKRSFRSRSDMPAFLTTMAERAGFEPARLIAYTISNRAHSTGLCDLSAPEGIIA